MLLGVDVTDHKMLQPIINNLNCKRIVLASSSPRRKQILENIVRLSVVINTLINLINTDDTL